MNELYEILGFHGVEYEGDSHVSLKTDISEVRAASIIRAIMEAVRTSETSVCFN
jgi:hypothetical protein